MKTSIYLTGTALLLAAVITTGQLCPGSDNQGNANQNTNQGVSDGEVLEENPLIGEWEWEIYQDGDEVYREVTIDEDESYSDVPNEWYGYAESIRPREESAYDDTEDYVYTRVSEEFGEFYVEGSKIRIVSSLDARVYTGEFTNDGMTEAEGTWEDAELGTSGTWTAEKNEYYGDPASSDPNDY